MDREEVRQLEKKMEFINQTYTFIYIFQGKRRLREDFGR
jgi:hypothetical protein